ncbi:MAG: helix-turn-helix domain-containing protein [Daejeonella sp.]|uniref:helix-turn-helix domain-containing protein n=1 Tax=Daejeonella sp. JGW-45 TaxID=3034148 RepID=UPI0023ECBC59|nr:helix-turn-helix transcriptional regulator [Daejeonella sp. JGW-45]
MKKSAPLKKGYSKGGIKLPSGYSGVSMEELKDDLFGSEGTVERDLYETELKEEILGDVIRHMRKLKHLTQEELGSKVGVGKAQISRIEKNYNNVTIANFLRILHALNVKVRLSVEVEAQEKKEIELSI